MALHIQQHLNRGARFCPLMKEMCTDGWTKSMGQDKKTGKRPLCAAWQSVEVFNHTEKTVTPVYDCSVFGWPTDLMTEMAQEVTCTTASTDKVANQIMKQRAAFLAALPSSLRERVIASDVRITEGANGHSRLPAGPAQDQRQPEAG